MRRRGRLPAGVLFFLAAFAAGAVALLSCRGGGEGTLERVRRERILSVGTDATYPPFETVDPRTRDVVGFDVELMRRIGEELGGVEIEFTVVPFDGILSSLQTGKFDAVISALTITEERAREVLFSRPYHAAGQSICIRSDGPVREAGDLPGRKVGVQLGTTGERQARAIPRAAVVSFDAIGAAFLDLRLGRVDAVIADTPTAAIYCREHPEVRIVGAPLTRESYGIAFRKKDADLARRVDEILDRLDRNGALSEMRRRWGLETP